MKHGKTTKRYRRKAADKLLTKWPAEWELEAERLAALYVRTTKGIVEFDQDQEAQRRDAAELNKLAARIDNLGCALRDLIGRDNGRQLIFAARAGGLRTGAIGRNELEALVAYCARLQEIDTQITQVAVDFRLAAEQLDNTLQDANLGNQSTLALRFLIAAAIPSYIKVFGRRPGKSNSDPGPFGRFVFEIIELVPGDLRPKEPSSSAISEVVRQWELRQGVAD